MSDEAAYHRAVLLLYPCLVILAVRSRPGELDAPILTVTDKGLVYEHAVVVRVYAADRYRKTLEMASRPSTTSDCSRASSGTASVHPELTSVTTRL